VAGSLAVERVPLHASCTIGVAVYPEHGGDSTMLLRHAEAAMYQSKMRHDAVTLYRPGPDGDSIKRLTLLADLGESLSAPGGADIDVHFQPQVRLDTGQPVGVEALLRWQTPTRGRVEAATVLHLAEHSDLMWPLTKHVLGRTIDQLDRWRTAGIRIRASVNVSMRDLNQPELIDWLTSRLRGAGIPAQDLQLEITETALASDPDTAVRVLQRLRQEDIAVSLDDFGTGYSSIERLRQFSLSEVKIDRSFVARCTHHPADAAVVEAIIGLAHRLGLRVVAEGVEDEQTRRLLLSGGCDLAQGWLYAPATPPDELTTWLATHHAQRRDG
jgi:EAL domain-containing protein (putative c-di-GMP-specific phosphodiesterase class I)